jgi:tetratricopeptide (TPR) repeat protein
MEIARRHLVLQHRPLLAGCLLALCCRAAPVVAQDMATAEALFREGRALFEAGDYPAACLKLAESQRQDPSSGTLLNLALCHEKEGKTATAWAEYLAAARLAITQHKSERAEECRRRAAALEPRLSYLTLQIAKPVVGLEVLRNDVVLEAGSWGSALPADPGVQRIRVSAPGYQTLELETKVGAAGDRQTLVIPPLAPSPQPPIEVAPSPQPARSLPPPAPAPSAPTPPAAPDRRLALGVGATGLALLAVGGTFGALALSDYSAAKRACPTRSSCSDDAITKRERAGTRANIANVSVGLGIAAVGVSAILLITQKGATPATPQSLRLEPTLTAGGAGLLYREAF